MLSSAFLVTAALLLSRQVGWLILGGLSSLGLFAGVIGVAIAFRLWFAINKSGHLDRKKRD
jgi:hypothetical protein